MLGNVVPDPSRGYAEVRPLSLFFGQRIYAISARIMVQFDTTLQVTGILALVEISFWLIDGKSLRTVSSRG
jgi:hypothetical protein